MNGEFNAAVHGLVYLNHKGNMVSSEALAANICTNPARVRKIMAKLKKAGLVGAKEGPEGGYSFLGDPAKTSLRTVAEAVDAQFVSHGWRSGADDMECLIASGMADLLDGIYDQLERLCLERLGRVTIADLDGRIFGPASHKEVP